VSIRKLAYFIFSSCGICAAILFQPPAAKGRRAKSDVQLHVTPAMDHNQLVKATIATGLDHQCRVNNRDAAGGLPFPTAEFDRPEQR